MSIASGPLDHLLPDTVDLDDPLHHVRIEIVVKTVRLFVIPEMCVTTLHDIRVMKRMNPSIHNFFTKDPTGN